MKIAVIGTGYVGLVAGACFAQWGFEVLCIDQDENKINSLKKGIIPIYEPGLEDIVQQHIATGHLKFSTDKSLLDNHDVLIIAVGTPQSADGTANMDYINSAVEDIIRHTKSDKTIIIKSTVPVGTAKSVHNKFENESEFNFDVISNPEFLREGAAINDFINPERVIIGCKQEDKSKEVIWRLYDFLKTQDVPIIFMNNETAELTKYAANCYLATRISFINEIADISEKVGGDIEKLIEGIGSDSRVGKHYLQPGPGFGGSCFPKDTQALSKIAQNAGVESQIIDSVIKYNDNRKIRMADKIINAFDECTENAPENKTIALLGLTFKAETDDMRDSASLDIVPKLLKHGIPSQSI